MATLFFFLTATLGLFVTGFVLAYLRKRVNLSRHQTSLVLSIGIFFTWLLSFFAPFLAPDSQLPNRIITVLGFAIATSSGILVYPIVYIFLLIRDRKRH